MTNGLVFDDTVSSDIFNTTIKDNIPASTPLHTTFNSEPINLSKISWSGTSLTRKQKNSRRNRSRVLRKKQKKVSIKYDI